MSATPPPKDIPGKEPGLRERKKARTRRAILDATLRLVEAQGYDATTTEQIAAEAEVSPSTFFRYFPTKEDAILQDEYDPLIVAAMEDAPSDVSPVEAARTGLMSLLRRVYAADRDKLYLRIRLALEVPSIRAKMIDDQREAETTLSGAIAHQLGRDSDDFEVQIASAVTLAAMRRCFEIWAEDGGTQDLPDMIDHALAVVQRGLDLKA